MSIPRKIFTFVEIISAVPETFKLSDAKTHLFYTKAEAEYVRESIEAQHARNQKVMELSGNTDSSKMIISAIVEISLSVIQTPT